MTLLDGYALVAFVADEPAAGEVEDLLRAGRARVVVVNLAEAIDIAHRIHAVAAAETRAVLEPLFLSEVVLANVSDASHGWLAAELRVRHYDKKARALSMADCFLLAHGVSDGGPIATADPSLAAIAQAEGVDVIGLPDSAGRRPA